MNLVSNSQKIGERLNASGYTIAVAESCTGGLLASSITDVAGSSDYFTLGVVTYSADAKVKVLGVNEKTIAAHSVVSEEVLVEMLKGLVKLAQTDVCLATTGYAGPSGGTLVNPVGTVFMGVLFQGDIYTYKNIFTGTRAQVKSKAVDYILLKLLELI